MTTTLNQERFKDYYQLANRLLESAEKETIAEVARILAIHVAHFQGKYGKLPMEETLKILHSVTLTDDELGVAAAGMEYLTAVIAVASGLVEDDPVQ